MYLRMHPDNPEERKIMQVVNALLDGAIIIYPTDTMYAIGCSIHHAAAIQKLYRIKNVTEKTAQFSFICHSISDFSLYTKSISTGAFKHLKKTLPGPYTFIFEASKEVPKVLKTKKNTIGLRMPDNKICMAIITALGHPIISTSLPQNNFVEDYTDPEVFIDAFEKTVDIVIDGGIGNSVPSSIISYVSDAPEIIRVGAGDVSLFEN
jgi:tRNA threonylcarbamoyl adenosine modification protein (Sua5/YciO/YrdC/YwlC family)